MLNIRIRAGAARAGAGASRITIWFRLRYSKKIMQLRRRQKYSTLVQVVVNSLIFLKQYCNLLEH
jgi:hypothetical protein